MQRFFLTSVMRLSSSIRGFSKSRTAGLLDLSLTGLKRAKRVYSHSLPAIVTLEISGVELLLSLSALDTTADLFACAFPKNWAASLLKLTPATELHEKLPVNIFTATLRKINTTRPV